jgi:hypothetical protein
MAGNHPGGFALRPSTMGLVPGWCAVGRSLTTLMSPPSSTACAMIPYLHRVRKVATIPLGVVCAPPDNTAEDRAERHLANRIEVVSTRSAVPAVPSPVSDAVWPGQAYLASGRTPDRTLGPVEIPLIIGQASVSASEAAQMPHQGIDHSLPPQ